MSAVRVWAVVPAAGVGRRMGSAIPKQYLPLAGRCVLAWALAPLLAHARIEAVVVAVGRDDAWWGGLAWPDGRGPERTDGGAERCHSVHNGLVALAARAAREDWVLVHDAARPCLRAAELDHLLDSLGDDPVGGLLAVPVHDTLKRADAAGRVEATLDRRQLWHAQTPQMFRYGVLREALETLFARGELVTDEAGAIEALGLRPRLVEGRTDNLKITRPEDLALAEFFLRGAAA